MWTLQKNSILHCQNRILYQVQEVDVTFLKCGILLQITRGKLLWSFVNHVQRTISLSIRLSNRTLCYGAQTNQDQILNLPLIMQWSTSYNIQWIEYTVILQDSEDSQHHTLLIDLLAEELGAKPEEIVDFELNVCDTQPGVIGGKHCLYI